MFDETELEKYLREASYFNSRSKSIPHCYMVCYPWEMLKKSQINAVRKNYQAYFQDRYNNAKDYYNDRRRNPFVKAVNAIRALGIKAYWCSNGEYRRPYDKELIYYISPAGFYYWTMGDPIETTWIINRGSFKDWFFETEPATGNTIILRYNNQ